MARELGLGVLAWAPIGGGVLTGKYTRQDATDTMRQNANAMRLSEKNLTIARTVDAIADELGKTSTQVALNWLRQRDQQVIPIVGARKPSQVQDSLSSVEFKLDSEALARLDEVSRIELGFPHDFLGLPYVQDVVLGDTRERLDR
jgi:aryl-alcohol dehydrogenase-like predicted oxidoreductase